MGTNFYCRKIDKARRKHFVDEFDRLHKELIESIDDISKDYKAVLSEFLYDNHEMEIEIHLGKRSGGWQFLWDYHNGRYFEPTLESIKEFLSQDNVTIYDEYGEKFTMQQFFDNEIGDTLYLREGLTDGSSINDGRDCYVTDWNRHYFKNDGLYFSKDEDFS